MKKKTNNNRLPVPGKVKKGFRYYVALVLTIALSGSLAMSAFAAGSDPLTVVNNLSTFIFGLIRVHWPPLCQGDPGPHHRRMRGC